VNFKRGRAKNRRAGCLYCKPWKMNHAKDKEDVPVVAAKQPEEVPSYRGRGHQKRAPMPQVLKSSCPRCGRLAAKALCSTKHDFQKMHQVRFRMPFCADCAMKEAERR